MRQQIEAFGERKHLAEWAEDARCVVSFKLLVKRVQEYGWEPERALTTPRGAYPAAERFTAFGTTQTLRAWASDPRCQVDYHCLASRLYHLGWSFGEALTTPRQPYGHNRSLITAWGETKSLKEWVEDSRCQVGFHCLKGRLNILSWEPERAISKPGRPKRQVAVD